MKGLKPAEVRQALCDAGLSPVGDKNELLKVICVSPVSVNVTSNRGSLSTTSNWETRTMVLPPLLPLKLGGVPGRTRRRRS